MKKTLVIGGGAAGVIIVAVIAVVFFLISNIDGIVKAAVEKVGSDVTQTEVVLADVEISLSDGKGTLRGFRVTNPAGFRTDDAFKFDEISVTLDIASLSGDPVIIREIVIDGPEITYEFGKGGSNIDRLKGNVESYQPAKAGSAGSSEESEGPKIIIENLYLRNGKVSIAATGLIDDKMTTGLPDIHLKNIGKKSGGATPAEIAKQTMDAVLKNVGSAVSKIDISALTDKLSGQLEGATQALGAGATEGAKAAEGAASSLSGAAEDAAGSLSGAAEDAGSKLKKLFD